VKRKNSGKFKMCWGTPKRKGHFHSKKGTYVSLSDYQRINDKKWLNPPSLKNETQGLQPDN